MENKLKENEMLIIPLGKFDYQSFPIDETAIEVPQEILDQIGIKYCFDVENNRVINYDNSEDLRIAKLEELRARREQECFSIINRGSLWYDKLSGQQLEELEEWYQKWLDVTETLKAPETPEWLK